MDRRMEPRDSCEARERRDALEGPVHQVYALSQYSFGSKDPPQREKDSSVQRRFERMREMFPALGVKRTVEAVLLVHHCNNPCIVLLNHKGGSFFKLYVMVLL